MSATRSAMDAEEEVSADGVASCTHDQALTQASAMQVRVPAVDAPSCSAGSVDGTAASYTLLHIPRSPEMQMAPQGKQGRQVSPPKERQEEEASELACEDPARVIAEGGHSPKKQGKLARFVKSAGRSSRGAIWGSSRWRRGGKEKKEKVPEPPVKGKKEKAAETPEKEKEKDKSLAAWVKSVVVGASFGITKGCKSSKGASRKRGPLDYAPKAIGLRDVINLTMTEENGSLIASSIKMWGRKASSW